VEDGVHSRKSSEGGYMTHTHRTHDSYMHVMHDYSCLHDSYMHVCVRTHTISRHM
jgi:hypothetical protein